MFREARVSVLHKVSDSLLLVENNEPQLELDLEGVIGCKYRGFSRLSDEDDQILFNDRNFPSNIVVRNWRQVSIGSIEELEALSAKLGVQITPALLGINVTLRGIAGLSSLEKGTVLSFPNQTILTVESAIIPRRIHAYKVARLYPEIETELFLNSARNLRGLVSSVFRSGIINLEDPVQIKTD